MTVERVVAELRSAPQRSGRGGTLAGARGTGFLLMVGRADEPAGGGASRPAPETGRALAAMKPPMNLDHNRGHDFYETMSRRRSAFRRSPSRRMMEEQSRSGDRLAVTLLEPGGPLRPPGGRWLNLGH